MMHIEFLVLKRNSTVTRVKSFYVACSKNGFLALDVDIIVLAVASSVMQLSQFGDILGILLVEHRVKMKLSTRQR